MKRWWLLLILFVTSVGLACTLPFSRALFLPEARPTAPAQLVDLDLVTANGMVEGARPEVSLRPEAMGTIAAIHVRENDAVKKGDLLLELNNTRQQAQLDLAHAKVAEAEAALQRVKKGARPEKRRAVAAIESARKAVFTRAQEQKERMQRLLVKRAVGKEQYETAYYQYVQAKAELETAMHERLLIEAPPLAEDIRTAEARLAEVQARVRLAEDALAKTRLCAPAAGCILRVYVEEGEMISATHPNKIMLLADLSRKCVRTFVEELDVSKVHLGMSATVTADSHPGQQFKGKVVQLLPRMGKRAPRSDLPNEYQDIYFREVLVELEGANTLPVNLRVRVQIETKPTHQKVAALPYVPRAHP